MYKTLFLHIKNETGASIDIVDDNAYNEMQKRNSIPFARCSTRILAYGATAHLPVLGIFTTTIESSSYYTVSAIHAKQVNYGCLRNYHSALALGLVQMKVITYSTSSCFKCLNPKKLLAICSGYKSWLLKLNSRDEVVFSHGETCWTLLSFFRASIFSFLAILLHV